MLEGLVNEQVAAAEDDEDDGNFEDVMGVEPDEVSDDAPPAPAEDSNSQLKKNSQAPTPLEAKKILCAAGYKAPAGDSIEALLSNGKVRVEVQEVREDSPEAREVTGPGVDVNAVDFTSIRHLVALHGVEKDELDEESGFEFLEVMEMVLRGMIDAGARMGKTGQLIEGITFAAAKGLQENTVCNFHIHIAADGSDPFATHDPFAGRRARAVAEPRRKRSSALRCKMLEAATVPAPCGRWGRHRGRDSPPRALAVSGARLTPKHEQHAGDVKSEQHDARLEEARGRCARAGERGLQKVVVRAQGAHRGRWEGLRHRRRPPPRRGTLPRRPDQQREDVVVLEHGRRQAPS